ncbi:MAG: hypothetical protein JXA33_10135 [Anaerolineae bacterium]|nr:hypothetical protein [Anaerolineae bacterium]
MTEQLTPIHPGEVLLEEFLRDWASLHRLAQSRSSASLVGRFYPKDEAEITETKYLSFSKVAPNKRLQSNCYRRVFQPCLAGQVDVQ